MRNLYLTPTLVRVNCCSCLFVRLFVCLFGFGFVGFLVNARFDPHTNPMTMAHANTLKNAANSVDEEISILKLDPDVGEFVASLLDGV